MAGPEHSLELLRCATDEPQQALQRWRELLARRPLNDFDHAEQRMLPAVLKNLRSLDPPEKGRMRGVHRYTWAKNARLHKSCREVAELFAHHDLACLVLKGVYLNCVVHRDLGIRPATDFDLLVPTREASRALQLLTAENWRVKGEWIEPKEGLENAVSLERDGVELDLHWNLLREARRPEHDSVLWHQAATFSLGTLTVGTLSPTHHLFHLLAVADREPENRLRYLYDIHCLRERFRDELRTDALEEFFRSRHILSRLDGLPLQELGWSELRVAERPGPLDRLWSESSRYLHGTARAEWNYALFPLLDYWFHFRGRLNPDTSLLTYLRKRLQVGGPGDFLRRAVRKAGRLIGLG